MKLKQIEDAERMTLLRHWREIQLTLVCWIQGRYPAAIEVHSLCPRLFLSDGDVILHNNPDDVNSAARSYVSSSE